MITTKSAKQKFETIRQAAAGRIDHITSNEKLAGAAVLGAAVGAAVTAAGSALLHAGSKNKTKVAKTAREPAA